MSEQRFDEWAIVELFGHQRIAGRVSEQQLAGGAFLRVDVPAGPKHQPFTKFYGAGAIYALTITDAKTATHAAATFAPRQEPMDRWSVQNYLQLPGGGEPAEQSGGDEDLEGERPF